VFTVQGCSKMPATLYRKFETYIPRNETARPSSHFLKPGSDLYIPRIGLTWSLYFHVLCERTLSSTAAAERRAGNCRQAEVGGSSLPSPLLLRLRREFTKITTNIHFSAQPQKRKEGHGTAAKRWLAAVPCPPLHSCC
jgi:hypothetical protein